MFRWRTEAKSNYTRAREARIRCALSFYEKHKNSPREVCARKSAERMLLGALGAFLLMPIPMIFGAIPVGIILFVLGLCYAIFGIRGLVNAGDAADKTLTECFALVDKEQPRLAEMLREGKEAGVHESWSDEE